jgi:ADP-ribose pyrophosphatase YjhB (NUDIX family)
MKAGNIRAMSVCALWRGDAVLAQEGSYPQTGEVYYRLPGGGIDLGELARDAAIREIREELEAEVTDVQQLGVLENIFKREGQQYHEIIFVFSGTVADRHFYDRDEMTGHEGAKDTYRAIWLPLSEIAAGRYTLYPTTLLSLLQGYQTAHAMLKGE